MQYRAWNNRFQANHSNACQACLQGHSTNTTQVEACMGTRTGVKQHLSGGRPGGARTHGGWRLLHLKRQLTPLRSGCVCCSGPRLPHTLLLPRGWGCWRYQAQLTPALTAAGDEMLLHMSDVGVCCLLRVSQCCLSLSPHAAY